MFHISCNTTWYDHILYLSDNMYALVEKYINGSCKYLPEEVKFLHNNKGDIKEMYFWEKVAKAGGIEKEFQQFLETKNTVSAPICASNCFGKCCNCDQVHVSGYQHSPYKELRELTTFFDNLNRSIKSFNPSYSYGCVYLSNSRCLIEEYKPLICITYFCATVAEKITGKRGFASTVKALDKIKYKLHEGLRTLASEELPLKMREQNSWDISSIYYMRELRKHLETLTPLVDEWKKRKHVLPPLEWHDHASGMINYYNNIRHMEMNAWFEMRDDKVYTNSLPPRRY